MKYRMESFAVQPNSRTIVHGLPIAVIDDPTPGLAWILIEDCMGATVLAGVTSGMVDDGAVYLGSISMSTPNALQVPVAVFRLGT